MKHNSVEFYRFIFTIVIVLLHFFSSIGIWVGGYIAVEFFFILSGFLIAMSLNRRNITDLSKAGPIALSFSVRRVKKLFPAKTLAFLLYFCFYIYDNKIGITAAIKLVINSIWELLFFDMAGFGVSDKYFVFQAWYLSALIIAGYFISYFYLKKRDTFIYLVAPISIILIYGRLATTIGTVDRHRSFAYPGIAEGLLRAFAGISLGIIAYHFYEYLSDKVLSRFFARLLCIIEIAGLLALLITVYRGGHTKKDFLIILFFGFLIIMSFWNQTPLDHLLDNKFSAFLGRISLPIFLTHTFVLSLVKKIYYPEQLTAQIIMFVSIAILFAAPFNWVLSIILKGLKYIGNKVNIFEKSIG